MMKKLVTALVLASHLLSLAPMPARAAYPTNDGPHLNDQFRVPKAKRVIVIKPLRWETGLASPTGELTCSLNGVWQAVDMLRELGCHVDIVSSRMFESYTYGSKLWRELGNTYQLAIVLNPGQMNAGMQRFVNGDSTNVQLLVVGGVRATGLTQWGADTLSRGMFDAASAAGSVPEAISSIRTAFVVPYNSTDTVWADRIATGRSVADSAGTILKGASGGGSILGVYRVLHPGALGNPTVSFVNLNAVGSVDSSNASLPATVDSLVRGAEWMGPVWKVKYAASAVNTDTSEVWFMKFISGSASALGGRTTPTLLWACIARFVDVEPIKYAVDFDDVTDLNASGTPPGTDIGQGSHPRWRQSAAESLLVNFARFGLKVGSNGINPGNAPGYVQGFTPAGEPTAAWNGYGLHTFPNGQPAHTYIKNLPWTHHSHDSTNGSITSNLVGGYGGYPPSNGTPPAASIGGGLQTGRRYASRWNPGATESDGWGAWGNFGIVQRLEYSDSVRKALGVGGGVPPYLTFPANQMLPINWRNRNGVNWPGTASYDSFYAVHGPLCPIDSVLWAFDYFLNRRKNTGTGRIWLRSGAIATMRNEALWADRDSFVAQRIAQYPRDRWTTRVGGRLIQAEIVHSFNQGSGTRATYLAAANYRAGDLLGLSNRATHAEMHSPIMGETYDSDVNKQMNAGTGLRDFPARQSTRIHYFHPSGLGGGDGGGNVSSMGDYAAESFLLGIHSNIRAMDKIAGRPVTKCVYAWEVYAKK